MASLQLLIDISPIVINRPYHGTSRYQKSILYTHIIDNIDTFPDRNIALGALDTLLLNGPIFINSTSQ